MSYHEEKRVEEEIISQGSGRDRGLHIFGRPWGLVVIAMYKLVWGFSEGLAGLLVFFSAQLIRRELIEDPQDWLANWLLIHTHLTTRSIFHVGLLLGLLGATKIILAIGLWFRLKFLRKWFMGFFAILMVFGVYYILIQFSLIKLFALGADGFVLWYLWKIFPRHMHDAVLK